MSDSLDLKGIWAFIVRAKKVSRISRVTSVLALSILIGTFIIVFTPRNSGACPSICSTITSLFCLGTPIGIVLGVAGLYFTSRYKRLKLHRDKPIDLSAVQLPEPQILWQSKGSIVLMVWAFVWAFEPLIMQIDYVLVIFIALCPLFLSPVIFGLWVRRPLRRGDYAEAIQRSERILRWFKGNRTILNLEGLALLFSGRAAESEQVHRQFIAQAIKYNDVNLKGLGFNNLANELMCQRRYDEALSLLETAIYLQPEFAGTYNSLAEWYLAQNLSSERALELINFGLQLSSSNKKMGAYNLKVANRAWAEAHIDKKETAQSTLSQAFRFSDSKNIPAYTELYRIAGETYIALGDTDKARDHFQKAAEIDPSGRIGKLAQAALERLQIDQK